MKTFESFSVDALYMDALRCVLADGAEVESRVSKTLEVHPVTMTLSRPSDRLITMYGRRINITFALMEVLWILLGRKDVATLSPFNARITDYSDDGETFNAAYGYRLRKSFGIDQIEDVIAGLHANPGSRQATLVVSEPASDSSYHVDYSGNMISARTTLDRACNVLSHLLIRNDKLDWMQIIRSNDIIMGVPYNMIQWTYLQEWIASAVGVEMGSHIRVIDSLHLYDYHLKDAGYVVKSNKGLPEGVFPNAHKSLGIEYTSMNELENIATIVDNVLTGKTLRWPSNMGLWTHLFMLTYAHKLYKWQMDLGCCSFLLGEIEHHPTDGLYLLCQLKFYWHMRWQNHHTAPLIALMMAERLTMPQHDWVIETLV